MFIGEKVRPLTPRSPCLLSTTVLVVLCSGVVLGAEGCFSWAMIPNTNQRW